MGAPLCGAIISAIMSAPTLPGRHQDSLPLSMTDLIIRFQPPPHWARPVFVHYWQRLPDNDESTWPGVPMEPDPEHPGWYRHRFPATSRLHLVFNDGQGNQSGDLARSRGGWLP